MRGGFFQVCHLSDQPESSSWWFARNSIINIKNTIIFCAHMYEAICETQLMLSMHKCDCTAESQRAISHQISFVCLCVLSISHTSLTIPSNTYLQLCIRRTISKDSRIECKHVFQVSEGDFRGKFINSLNVPLESCDTTIQGFKLNACRTGDGWKCRVSFKWHFSLPKYSWPKFYSWKNKTWHFPVRAYGWSFEDKCIYSEEFAESMCLFSS